MVAYIINFLFTVGGVSGDGEWNRNKCSGGQNRVSDARSVCPAYLHCEFLLLTSFFLFTFLSLPLHLLPPPLPSPSLSSILSSPTFCFLTALYIFSFFISSSTFPHFSLHSSLFPLPSYWCIAWNRWWPKRSYAQPWQCKFQFVSSMCKRNHFNIKQVYMFTSHMYDCTSATVCFRSPLMQELLNKLMGNWRMEKTMQLATFHWVTLLLRYMSCMCMSMPQHAMILIGNPHFLAPAQLALLLPKLKKIHNYGKHCMGGGLQ